jgi:uncharacterized protein YlxP (DUF503 family)
MNVGVCRLRLRLAENMTLKGKRQVIKSIIALVKNKFNVSIAEVDDQDLWQLATLGISFVSNDSKYTDGLFTSITNFINSEIIPF